MGDKPINFKFGRVRASVWANESENGPWYSVSFSRPFKDKDDKWQDSTRFSREDLPLLVKLADKVHSFLYERVQESEPGDETESAMTPAPGDAAPPQRNR